MATYRLQPAAAQPLDSAIDAVIRAMQRVGGARAQLEVRKVPIIDTQPRSLAQTRTALKVARASLPPTLSLKSR